MKVSDQYCLQLYVLKSFAQTLVTDGIPKSEESLSKPCSWARGTLKRGREKNQIPYGYFLMKAVINSESHLTFLLKLISRPHS